MLFQTMPARRRKARVKRNDFGTAHLASAGGTLAFGGLYGDRTGASHDIQGLEGWLVDII